MTSFMHRAGGIDWYCEQSGDGPNVVLIPSGEGDCASFARTAANLARDFSVLTFDTPGFSRTTPPPDANDVSMQTLAPQIAELLRSLGISKTTVYGSSSGGVATLDLLLGFPDLVRNAIVHEVAIVDPTSAAASPLAALLSQEDAAIVAACQHMFRNWMNVEGEEAWDALGSEFHERLSANYVTWVRRYAGGGPPILYDATDLRGRPLAWTIGAYMRVDSFFSNVRLAQKAGIEMEMLMSAHFPQVNMPDGLAEHIRAKTRPYL